MHVTVVCLHLWNHWWRSSKVTRDKAKQIENLLNTVRYFSYLFVKMRKNYSNKNREQNQNISKILPLRSIKGISRKRKNSIETPSLTCLAFMVGVMYL